MAGKSKDEETLPGETPVLAPLPEINPPVEPITVPAPAENPQVQPRERPGKIPLPDVPPPGEGFHSGFSEHLITT